VKEEAGEPEITLLLPCTGVLTNCGCQLEPHTRPGVELADADGDRDTDLWLDEPCLAYTLVSGLIHSAVADVLSPRHFEWSGSAGSPALGVRLPRLPRAFGRVIQIV